MAPAGRKAEGAAPPEPAGALSPLVLAYIGDAVYELLIRSHLVRRGPARPEHLHREAVRYVSAAGQARLAALLEGHLTAAEKDILRRGRNAKPLHLPRSAAPEEYHASTALESLFGYLYLQGDWERLEELTRIMVAGARRQGLPDSLRGRVKRPGRVPMDNCRERIKCTSN